MGKKAALIGMGCGPYTVTAEGMMAIEKADLICGSKRMLELLPDTDARLVEEYHTDRLFQVIMESGEEFIAVLYSGDTGLYSGAVELYACLKENGVDAFLISGVSVVSYFASRIGRSWETFNIVSCHGRKLDIFKELKKDRPLFVYTSDEKDVKSICKKLLGYRVTIGERLGYEDERIISITSDEAGDIAIDRLNVMLIEK